jgi:tRNA 2-selenouridine synthase
MHYLMKQITQQWIYAASGIDYPRVKGGYKALRRFLIDETHRIMQQITSIVIGGRFWMFSKLLSQY